MILFNCIEMTGKIRTGDVVWGSLNKKAWERIGTITRVYGTKSHIRVETDKKIEFHTYSNKGGRSKLISMYQNAIFTCRHGIWRSRHAPDMFFCVKSDEKYQKDES